MFYLSCHWHISAKWLGDICHTLGKWFYSFLLRRAGFHKPCTNSIAFYIVLFYIFIFVFLMSKKSLLFHIKSFLHVQHTLYKSVAKIVKILSAVVYILQKLRFTREIFEWLITTTFVILYSNLCRVTY